MRKLLSAAMAAALVFPAGPVSAELLKNMKLKGGVDVRVTNARNIQDFATRADGAGARNDRIENTHSRTWVTAMWDMLDDVHGTVMLRKNDRAWASTGGGGQGAGGNQSLVGGTQTSDIASNIYVQQANLKIDKLFGMWDTTIGRQFYGEPGDLIAHWGFKPSYGLTVTAVDAFRMDGMNEWMDWSALFGKTTGGTSTTLATTPTAGVTVLGLEAKVKNMPVMLNPFVWHQITPGTGALGTDLSGTGASASGKNDQLWVFGSRFKAEAMGAYVKGDIALNAGQNRTLTQTASPSCDAQGCTANGASYKGMAFLINGGYKMDVGGVGGITPWLTYGMGTGRKDTRKNSNEDFQGIASSSRFGIIYGRFTSADSATLGSNFTGMDGITGVSRTGLTNRNIVGAGVKVTPSMWNKLTVGASYWNFRYAKATSRVGANAAQLSGAKEIGSEMDLTFDYKHSDNVMVNLGLGTFQPGKYIKESAKLTAANPARAVNPVTMVMGDVSVKF